jgi:hypothetical protein
VQQFKDEAVIEEAEQGIWATNAFENVKDSINLSIKDKIYNPESKLNTLSNFRKLWLNDSNSPKNKLKRKGTMMSEKQKRYEELNMVFDYDMMEDLLEFQGIIRKKTEKREAIMKGQKVEKDKNIFAKSVIPY